jgi:hypothetical protein
MAETAMPLLFMNSYHSKGATHLSCICSLAVATIARWWKCSHSEGATQLLGFWAICIAETAMPRGESMLLAFDDGDAARSLDTGVSTCNPSLFLQDLFHLLAGQVRRWGKPADQLLLAIQVPQMLREGCDLRLIDDRLRMLVLPLAYLLPGYPWPNFSQDDLWPIR